jgi:cytochrome c oxidase subunit 2
MPFNFPVSPPQASSLAPEYDAVFYLLLALTIFFTGIVLAAVVFFVAKYRRGTKADRSRPVYENLALELSWTIIPLILALFMFYAGAKVFVDLRTPPKDSEQIFVIGKQWMWHIEHPNGVRENNTLHVPVGKDIKLVLISQDVLHAFYVPAFRQQVHVVPGRYTDIWFKPTRIGEYHLFCNMYCGTQHSEMCGSVIVMDQRKYAEWLANNGESVPHLTMEQAGARKFNSVGCANCHGATDTLRAPSLIGIFGKKRTFADGSSLVADDAYLRESIVNPYNHITAGYGQSMPVYTKDQLNEEDILNILAYIKTAGTGPTPPVGSYISESAIPTEQTKQNSVTPLAVNAIRAQTYSTDSTPTIRTGHPAVGAIAARGINP